MFTTPGKRDCIVTTESTPGKLECIVTTESGERIVVAELTEGKYFGEIALLSFEGNNRRTADVRSVGYSELLVLSKKALMSVRFIIVAFIAA